MDAVEKFVADLLAKTLRVTDPAQVATIEAQVPQIVEGVMGIVAIINVARAATKPGAVAKVPPPPPPPA